jgi:hypothetical protein
MPLCNKCGDNNPLGRVFCQSCGEKLDLTSMSSEEVAGSSAKPWILRNKWLFWVVPAVLVVFLLLLALWPKTQPIGEAGTLVGGRRIEDRFEALGMLSSGESVEIQFSEKDLNGYIEFIKGKSLGPRNARINIGPGYVRVRMLKRVANWSMFGQVWKPRLSYDVLYTAAGDRLTVRKVSVGHLPLVLGKGIVSGEIAEQMKKATPWSLLKDPEEISIKNDKIILSYRR